MDTTSCCNQESHHGHLCVLASQEKIEEIRSLVKDPAYICFQCGRVADAAENLCNPMPLQPSS